MPQGLQCYDDQGRLTLSVTDRLIYGPDDNGRVRVKLGMWN